MGIRGDVLLKSRIMLQRGRGEGMVSPGRRAVEVGSRLGFTNLTLSPVQLTETNFSSFCCQSVSRKEIFPSLYRICLGDRGTMVFN